MKGIFSIILSVIILTACQEVFVPEIETLEPILVIEGMFTPLPENNIVKISYTQSFNQSPYFPYVEDAYVEIEDDDGNIIPFDYYYNGIYKCDTNDLHLAEPGITYVLRVITSEGNIYESSPQIVVECPEISKLICRHDQELALTEDLYGDIFEINMDGIEIISETEGLLPMQNYYLYRWVGYEEHVNIIASLGDPKTYYYLYRHRRLNGRFLSVIRTENADEFANFQIKNNRVIFISTESMADYIQPFSDTSYSLFNKWFDGLIFRLQQFSISDDAYLFWRDAELQLEAEGHLFDPIASQLKGNIKCVSDSTENVIGIFSASDVSEKYAYFYIDNANRTTTIDLDGFTELFLDTCSLEMPEDWISKPTH